MSSCIRTSYNLKTLVVKIQNFYALSHFQNLNLSHVGFLKVSERLKLVYSCFVLGRNYTEKLISCSFRYVYQKQLYKVILKERFLIVFSDRRISPSLKARQIDSFLYHNENTFFLPHSSSLFSSA